VLGVVVIGTLAAVALGSLGSGGTPTILVSKADFDRTVHVNSDRVKFQTKDATDVRVQKLEFALGSYSGWHHHPGIVLVTVASGSVTVWDENCKTETYGPGLPNGACKGRKSGFRRRWAESGLAGSEPAFEVAAVDDAEDEEGAVFAEEVVHDAVVADAEPVEGVCLSADRSYLLAADAAGSGCGGGELFEAGADALAYRGWQLFVGAFGGGREAYLVALAQALSSSGLVRPWR
jgi:hypothetical protein